VTPNGRFVSEFGRAEAVPFYRIDALFLFGGVPDVTGAIVSSAGGHGVGHCPWIPWKSGFVPNLPGVRQLLDTGLEQDVLRLAGKQCRIPSQNPLLQITYLDDIFHQSGSGRQRLLRQDEHHDRD
jgi:hypothetical protein